MTNFEEIFKRARFLLVSCAAFIQLFGCWTRSGRLGRHLLQESADVQVQLSLRRQRRVLRRARRGNAKFRNARGLNGGGNGVLALR